MLQIGLLALCYVVLPGSGRRDALHAMFGHGHAQIVVLDHSYAPSPVRVGRLPSVRQPPNMVK